MSMDPVQQPDHPGRQCHEVHPGIPHTVLTPDSQTAAPGIDRPMTPLPPPPSLLRPITGTVDASPDWSRFDEWASRALEFLGDAVSKSDDTDDPQMIPTAAQVRQDAARVCVDLACAASPYRMGAPTSGLPMIEMPTFEVDP